MKLIITKDSSITFHNDNYDETYHSVSGARQESVKKFVEPCKKLFCKDRLDVLDVCFGIGYNTAALMDSYSGELNIVCLENDPVILQEVLKIDPDFRNYDLIKELVRKNKVEKGNVKISLVIEDARKSVKKLNVGFDICFLDPFSPKKCPELWTVEFLSDIFRLMKKGGILTTYSCARSVRENLERVGFVVKDGPVVGRRGPSTVGVKN